MPKIDIAALPWRTGSRYPAPFDALVKARAWRKLGDAAGLTQFGVNLVRLPPGAWSSQRHWHEREDEFCWVLEGEAVLVEDAGETTLRAGDGVGWKAGVADGHHLINRSGDDVVLLVVGSRREDEACRYPDIDMDAPAGVAGYTHKDGTPY